MSKEMTAAEVAAWLAERNFESLDEVNRAAETMKEDEAESYILTKLSPVLHTVKRDGKNVQETDEPETEKKAEAWTRILFELSRDFADAFKAETKNRGQGQRSIRFVSFETHEGTLKVELSSPVKKADKK